MRDVETVARNPDGSIREFPHCAAGRVRGDAEGRGPRKPGPGIGTCWAAWLSA